MTPAAQTTSSGELDELLRSIRQCEICRSHLPLPPRPILQASAQAKILIAGQAPGLKTHHRGRPFDDASGERLRSWLGITLDEFYDPQRFAIIPMGFCYPGCIIRGGKKQGDKPPRPECSSTWHDELLALLPQIELTLILGQYAIDYHLGVNACGAKLTVTQAVENWQEYWPQKMALPHPSPRNALWLKRHPKFETEQLPSLRRRIATLLTE
jgi:uracil-DNA glycosylase